MSLCKLESEDVTLHAVSSKAQELNSIASQMIASQVKNRKSKIFALTQAKIGGETRVHQRRRKNHQFRQ